MRSYRMKTETCRTVKELTLAFQKLHSPRSLFSKKPSPFQSPKHKYYMPNTTRTQTTKLKLQHHKIDLPKSKLKSSELKSSSGSKRILSPNKLMKNVKKGGSADKKHNNFTTTIRISSYHPPPKRNYQFKMIKRIGKSQTGQIILAYSNVLKTVVAMKIFERAKIKPLFLIEEIKIQLFCRHPNILPAYGYHIGKKEAYLMMEAGRHNLYKEILQRGPFDEHKAANYAFQLLEAVDYLHKHGIMHRDIKPENVICFGSVIKLTDFGWSIITDTTRRTLCGTIDYISPEVANRQNYDHKIDCWSVGVLLYEMLTTKAPFKQSEAGFRSSQMTFDFETLVIPQEWSHACKDIVKRLLEPESKKRMSAREAIDHLWIKNCRKRQSMYSKTEFTTLKEELALLF